MFVVLDKSGQEVEHETHRADPSVEFGWPSPELRDVVLDACREVACAYIIGRADASARSRRGPGHLDLRDLRPKHRRRF
jgi:hypothetical protein